MKREVMTHEEKLEWLRSIPSETISPFQLAVVADGDSYSYNIAAKEGKLNLPHMWRGRNLRIWKQPVIDLLEGGVKSAGIHADSDDHGAENLCPAEP